jgi:hypothetical protein
MKHVLTFLLALAAAAHGQFAVMHTNGVVTSPTNLTIQQSNVSGLSNALAGKLATNGSAAGLTGFVGTTNAETARGNLGISNSFAGQFHADFYDDFSRYSNGTQFTNGASPLIGSNYVLRSSFVGDSNINDLVVPFVTNGVLTGTNTATWYLNTELSRPVYNFGMEWTWESDPSKNIDLAWPVILIRPDDAWLDKVIHIVVTPLALNIDVAPSGTTNLFKNIFSTNWGHTFARLERGVKHVLSGEIEGNTLRIRLAGRSVEVTDPQIGDAAGRYFTFEYFGNAPSTNVASINSHRVWVNSPSMMHYASQPFSERLLDFANGDARVTRYLTVGTNKSDYFNNQLTTNFPVFVDGGIKVKGRLQGFIVGNAYGEAPVVNIRPPTGIPSGGTGANTNTTNRTVLWTRNLATGTLGETGNRWVVTAVGSFASTTNEKRVVFEMAGGSQLDTGFITNTGQWNIESTIYRTATNTHEAFAIFQSDELTKTARWTFNNDTTFGVDIEGAGTSNNEVILRGAWADWYP